jgi:hypothetical protein
MYTCFQNFRVHIQNQVMGNFEIRLKMTFLVEESFYLAHNE